MVKAWLLLESFFGSPITWGVVALVAFALALSGKLSMGAARLVLWLAFGAAVFGVFRAEVILKTEPLMRFLILGCCAFGFAAGTLALNRWMVSPKTAEVIPITQFPPAGFITFLGQILNGSAPMMQANQTDLPLDDVHLSIMQSILKSASDPGPWQVGWQKEIEIGTCRAKLTVGLPERFPVGDYNWIRFDIFMLTRLQTYREIINLTKENEKEYKAELNFYNGADIKPAYTQTMKLGIVNFHRSAGELKQPVKQRALLLANRIQPFYNEQAESGRSLHMISPPQSKEDADANTKTENAFHEKVVNLFHQQFGEELEEIISEMQKLGLDVTDIRQRTDAHDYWMIPYIVKDLHDLASQIDNQGNLVH